MLKEFRRWLAYLLVLPVILLFLMGCDVIDTSQTQAPASPTGTLSNSTSDTSNVPGAQSPTVLAGLPSLKGSATVVMTIQGKATPITIQIDGTSAPITAGNFVDLVKRGVYNGTRFHRVIRQPEPFVAQGGDPQSKDAKVPIEALGTGSFVDPKTSRPRYIPLEITPAGKSQPILGQTLKGAGITTGPKLKHTRGAIAMARSPLPDSASAQFYFALADLPFLDGDYAVFGYVSKGMEVVDQIQQGDQIAKAEVTEGLGNLTTASAQP
jgi:peptidyl-prolyl cis-trans isomerase B (cyclophilin B)